jgi:hypothetical protein
MVGSQHSHVAEQQARLDATVRNGDEKCAACGVNVAALKRELAGCMGRLGLEGAKLQSEKLKVAELGTQKAALERELQLALERSDGPGSLESLASTDGVGNGESQAENLQLKRQLEELRQQKDATKREEMLQRKCDQLLATLDATSAAAAAAARAHEGTTCELTAEVTDTKGQLEVLKGELSTLLASSGAAAEPSGSLYKGEGEGKFAELQQQITRQVAALEETKGELSAASRRNLELVAELVKAEG